MEGDLENYYNFVLPLIKQAGNVSTYLLLCFCYTRLQVILGAKDYNTVSKELSWDIVTDYDKKVEETLIKKIREKYPNHE